MKMTRIPNYTHLLAVASGVLLAGTSLSGQGLLAVDDFNYGLTNGALLHGVTPTGSSGFAGAWYASNNPASNSTWRSGGLSYTDRKGGVVGGTGGHLLISGMPSTDHPGFGGGNAFMRLDFSAATVSGISANGGAWFSFLAQRTGPVTNDAAFGTTAYPRNFGVRIMSSDAATSLNNASAVIGQGSYGGGGTRGHLDEWAVGNFDTVAYAPTGADFYANVDFIVGHADINNNTIRLWVNPDLDDPTINDGYVRALDTGNGLSGWYALGLEGGSDGSPRRGGEFIIDHFRLGTTMESVGVVPEPSTYALMMGLFAAGLLVYRRRKS